MLGKRCFHIFLVLSVVSTCIFITHLRKRDFLMYDKVVQERLPTKTMKDNLTSSSSSSDPILSTAVKAVDNYVDQQLVKLPWTSVYGKGEKDSYHFFSAYFDDRIGASDRPAVIVMGYVLNGVKNIPLYCILKYADGHSVCLKEQLKRRNPIPCHAPNLGADTYHYYCPISPGEDPPTSVMISSSSACSMNFTSNEIPVGNRDIGKGKVLKKFSVCVSGPVIENKNILQDLVEFISMSRLMGAELITFYISREQLKESIIQYILHRYSDVRVIEWKRFEKWSPLHYYGQMLIMSDCMYRSMYETEYLVPIDIDEMIVPIKANSWSEMLQDLPQREKYAAFIFENGFFGMKNVRPLVTAPECGNFNIAKYFTKTDRHICFPGYGYRAKLMTRPRFVQEAGIHFTCSVISGYEKTLQVPNTVAFLAHYRDPIPDDCINQQSRIDNSLLKYSDRFSMEMCSRLWYIFIVSH